MADLLLGEVPLVGLLAHYVFHPKCLVSREDERPVMRLVKEAAFFEGRFRIDKLSDLDEDEERRVILSLLMMVLLERARG